KIATSDMKIDLTGLLALPGALVPGEDECEIMERARPVVVELLDQAIGQLKQMRIDEGRAIADDILACQTVIFKCIEKIESQAPKVIEQYHEKLELRIDEMASRAALEL